MQKRFVTVDEVKRHFFPRLVEAERQQGLTVEQRAEEMAKRLAADFGRRLGRRRRPHGSGPGKRNAVWLSRYGTAATAPCHWCGAILTFREATQDHLLRRGEPGYEDVRNKVIACETCNGRRAKELAERLA